MSQPTGTLVILLTAGRRQYDKSTTREDRTGVLGHSNNVVYVGGKRGGL